MEFDEIAGIMKLLERIAGEVHKGLKVIQASLIINERNYNLISSSFLS